VRFRKGALLPAAALAVTICCGPEDLLGATQSTNQTVTITLNSAGVVSVPSTLNMTEAGTIFNNFTGSLSLNYRARTTQGGSATLAVEASSDFSPAGGPSVASGGLTYTCGAASLGTACSGTQTVSTSSQTPVLSVGSNACVGSGCASADPATQILSFVLSNTPAYKTGSYSAQLLFTFSTT
jgi:hypothetical protein